MTTEAAYHEGYRKALEDVSRLVTNLQDGHMEGLGTLLEEIDRKIEQIYGVRQDGEQAIFRSRLPEAKEVQIAGDFNDWMPHTTPMRRLANGDFEARLRLPKGKYRYRLVIDGRWSHDTYNPAVETNEYGELNSIAEINA